MRNGLYKKIAISFHKGIDMYFYMCYFGYAKLHFERMVPHESDV